MFLSWAFVLLVELKTGITVCLVPIEVETDEKPLDRLAGASGCHMRADAVWDARRRLR
jgi:hypothetical protein